MDQSSLNLSVILSASTLLKLSPCNGSRNARRGTANFWELRRVACNGATTAMSQTEAQAFVRMYQTVRGSAEDVVKLSPCDGSGHGAGEPEWPGSREEGKCMCLAKIVHNPVSRSSLSGFSIKFANASVRVETGMFVCRAVCR